jgi:hypothetical protein
MAGALLCLAAAPGWAGGTLSATVTATPALGKVVSGAAGSGTTTFTVTASSGAIAPAGGSAVRVTTGTSLVTVTATCGGSGACASSKFEITATGSPSGRMGALGVFEVSTGSFTPTIVSGAGTSTLIFENTASVAHGGTETFLLGMAIPISDNTSGATGAAISQFEVLGVAPDTGTPVNLVAGSATATVFRPISIGNNSLLNFGSIVRSTLAGTTNTVTIAAAGGRSISGTGNGALAGSTGTAATYTVTGEGQQTFTISAPNFNVTSGANTLTVTTTTTIASGALGGTVGSSGTLPFGVGGSIAVTNTTPSGLYTGNLVVTVTYN